MQQKGYNWILLVLALLVISLTAGKTESGLIIPQADAKTAAADAESRISPEDIHLSACILNGSAASLQARQQVTEIFPACFSGHFEPADQFGRLTRCVYSSRKSLAYKDKQFLLLFPFHFFT
jgi:hypothetical protein